jgi:hypothetical protein
VSEAKQLEKQRPTVFIGSSTEGLKVAKTIQLLLDRACEVSIWSQGIFGLGEGSLESLVKSLDLFDFAILVLTPDDLIETRGNVKQAPRDNVLLELGLFIGALGRDRSFAVYDRNAKLHLPSDLAGVTMATYSIHQSGNLRSSLGAASTLIEDAIDRLGKRPKLDSQYSTQINSSQTVEIEVLTNQVKEMSQMLRQLVESLQPVDVSNKDCSSNVLGLESFVGKWFSVESNSYFYPKVVGDSLVVPYCYGGNDRLISVYYDWTKSGEFLFARFEWINDVISGFGFFRPISNEQTQGWWWTDNEDFTLSIPDISKIKMGEGTSVILKRSKDEVIPEWAAEFHWMVSKLGSVKEAIKTLRG